MRVCEALMSETIILVLIPSIESILIPAPPHLTTTHPIPLHPDLTAPHPTPHEGKGRGGKGREGRGGKGGKGREEEGR